ncbi:MAG: hypothetical protein IJ099_05875 [Alphaproteobacteria bacterium]|nr:hypothetical protein [Alphaproteobacteria bacterium]
MIARTMCKGMFNTATLMLSTFSPLITATVISVQGMLTLTVLPLIMLRDVFIPDRPLAKDEHRRAVSAIDELNNPTIPVSREMVMAYYASKNRCLTLDEANEFTRFVRYYHQYRYNPANQDIVPYILGEFTETELRTVYVANDNMVDENTDLHISARAEREAEEVAERRRGSYMARMKKMIMYTRLINRILKRMFNEILDGGCNA